MRKIRLKHITTIISIVTLVIITTIAYARSEINAQVVNPPNTTDASIFNQSSEMTSLASQDVSVSVAVLPNIHLSIINKKPRYGTNLPLGVTLHIDKSNKSIEYWTVTANF